MRKERKQKLLDKFWKKDSRESMATPVWPKVSVGGNMGSATALTYVRIKQHGVWFLVPVVKHYDGMSTLTGVMTVYEQIHFDAFNVYRYYKVSLRHPTMNDAARQEVASAYLDVNQEDDYGTAKKS